MTSAPAFSILNVAQRSPEWMAARCGRLTGTGAGDMMATVKKRGEEAAARRELRVRLAVERFTGMSAEDTYQTRDMARGVELEGDALLAYQAATGTLIRRVGFLSHDELLVGCSPDAIVGDFQGVVEAKCPRMGTHYSYLRGGVVPTDYRYQLIHALWITGAEWSDFCSFDPRFPPRLQLFIVRLQRRDIDMKAYELMVRIFLREIEDEVAAMQALMDRVAA
jgi:hypothetical protein